MYFTAVHLMGVQLADVRLSWWVLIFRKFRVCP